MRAGLVRDSQVQWLRPPTSTRQTPSPTPLVPPQRAQPGIGRQHPTEADQVPERRPSVARAANRCMNSSGLITKCLRLPITALRTAA